jgi:molybdopterin synthase catalytic subunit
MKIRVKLFASLKEAAGFSDKELIVSDGITVREVVRILSMSYNLNSRIVENLLYAINEEYCNADSELADMDILAVFPPVSGG